MSSQRNAVIVGASSGIGEALAVSLAQHGYHVTITARREDRLKTIVDNLATPGRYIVMDVADTTAAMETLSLLINQLDDIELFVLCAGVGFENKSLEWAPEQQTIGINVMGFAAMANVACSHLEKRGSGRLVSISSIAALRGFSHAPAYNASKAFMSNYAQGIRHRFAGLNMPVQVLDVQPGFVDTAMAKGDRLFWVASPEKAARQIIKAIEKGKSHVYITKRWRLFAWLVKWLPNWLYHRV